MGVDARMYIPSNKIYTNDELAWLSYRLGEAIGPDVFMLFDDKYHALEIETDYIPDSLPKCLQVINVNLGGRYYGQGYERGNLWNYIAVAVWIEKNMGITPYYGGDSSDYLELFDASMRAELINHWCKVGGIPYRDRNEHHTNQPICPRCNVLATQFGYGGNYTAWTCLGCGKNWNWFKETGTIGGKKDW